MFLKGEAWGTPQLRAIAGPTTLQSKSGLALPIAYNPIRKLLSRDILPLNKTSA